MMAGEKNDLSGRWDGTFQYPQGAGAATPFCAVIDEVKGSFSGTIIEPDIYNPLATLEAGITGHRAGRAVDFTKIYRNAQTGYENPVDYVGQLSADGTCISGMWSLLEWNGTFEMIRETAIELECEDTRRAEEPVRVGT